MNIKSLLILTTFLVFNFSCEKKEITQELCESKTNRSDCEAAGCTYTCGISLTEEVWNITHRKCLARHRVGVCLAIVPFQENMSEQDITWEINPGSEVWVRRAGSQVTPYTYYEYVHYINETNQRVEALGYTTLHFDPCLEDDPDETLFPWEGSCETDWWSEDLWDDVIPE
ncbi:MAG: hypothetical protein CVU65_14835 [Deltaproteobacteria bacterium HGW-Deltaproteobacteria-22]|nr:MAG: hypothetical protein CVU65_14835 [Deltaproteobacteria bacterium HGW-Deltaproteobacteria-22]